MEEEKDKEGEREREKRKTEISHLHKLEWMKWVFFLFAPVWILKSFVAGSTVSRRSWRYNTSYNIPQTDLWSPTRKLLKATAKCGQAIQNNRATPAASVVWSCGVAVKKCGESNLSEESLFRGHNRV